MTDALADVAEKNVDEADKGTGGDKDATAEAARVADAAKAETDKKAADEAAKGKTDDAKDKPKEFVADSTKTDEENDAARAEFDKANGGDKDDKKGGLPDDWREQAAGKDAELLKLAKRYGSVGGILKALDETKKALRSGTQKLPMPDASDDKAMAEWRKSEGIPDDPTGYKLPETVQKRLVDEDKPLLSNFADYMHKNNAHPEAVALGAAWYVDMAEAAEAKRSEDDKVAGDTCEDKLRKDWSHSEFKGNVKLAHRFVETVPGLGTDFAVARTPDGRRLVDNHEFISWAADMGRAKFGDLAFTTSDGERKHTARKEEIEKVMNTDIDEYRRSGMDKEYAEILEKEERRAK